MMLTINFITGAMLGFEYVQDHEFEDMHHIVLDLVIVRLLFTWEST